MRQGLHPGQSLSPYRLEIRKAPLVSHAVSLWRSPDNRQPPVRQFRRDSAKCVEQFFDAFFWNEPADEQDQLLPRRAVRRQWDNAIGKDDDAVHRTLHAVDEAI